eukprot:TRINITY_DN3482_c0_g1_i6.p1 TRINITY_DN3482_c0_g1~~TRINITY_DN3482_c0_g1_i6.p1  ORF type:complete len:179 (+),score=63.81 TRINITY_DN3482_c0_g1_i6:90-626(+)
MFYSVLVVSYFFFFFFKQKTAYEMLRSLVGSEMCIRDRGDAGEAPPPVNYQLGRTASWNKGPSTHQQGGGSGNPTAPPVTSGPSHGGAPPPSYNYGAPPPQHQQQQSNLGVASHQPPHSPTTPTSNGGNAPPPVYPTRYRHEPYSPSKAKTYISSNPTSPKVSDPGAYPTIPLGSPTE